MDKFDNRGESDRCRALGAAATRGQQHQNGAKALAACINDVMANIFDEWNLRMKLFDDIVVDRVHVIIYCIAYGLIHASSRVLDLNSSAAC